MRCRKQSAVRFCRKHCYGTSTSSVTVLRHVLKPGHLAARHRSHGVLKESRWETAWVARALCCVQPVQGSLYVFSVKALMGKQAPCPKRQVPAGNQASSCLLSGWVSGRAVLLATPWVQPAEVGAPPRKAARTQQLSSGTRHPSVVWKLLLEGCFALLEGDCLMRGGHYRPQFWPAGRGSKGLDPVGLDCPLEGRQAGWTSAPAAGVQLSSTLTVCATSGVSTDSLKLGRYLN